ncbi:DUF5682 family protein [Streptomyces cocklensis]|uniref:Uncharacterized protein n=1 Tax=Actinacidiphila cocklensis TaxID=887465 RepID=A0A9W4GTM8_9ACTN|nr:DUF5682 family protein [Actinacidiphila cocklensis]MDD1060914.1 DUF5682 family protein [Actinacidiphila cocklensis]CAG6396684.1 conserved hypothetical protein [Actinacidiphila cocklensis]
MTARTAADAAATRPALGGATAEGAAATATGGEGAGAGFRAAVEGVDAVDRAAATAVARAAGAAEAAEDVVLLGVRHHGPGSARAVLAALEAYRPQAVLIEGPPEADVLVGLAGDPAMRPPVALLAHVVDDPARAAFWPFAEFSPEWVALRWATKAGAEVRFIDLPAAHSLALRPATGEDPATDPGAAPGGSGPEAAAAADVRVDPLAVLAETAGYDDPERWWEDAVEHRGGTADGSPDSGDPLAPFAALAEAMGAIRAIHGDGGHLQDPVREAHMRLRLREARRAYERTAVVCGAWHVPALAARTAVAADRQLLKGLPKAKVETTWVPWTHRRLARASGYGAGIDSPGWYRHLFTAADRPVTRWMTKVAGLLREEDLPVSSAHVIEAVRLADTLAAMRGRPLAGLGETTDAIRAVMCEGSDVPLALIRDRLVVGDVLGEVPPDAPAVPLARDLARQQRTLRLKPEALERELDLDLRKDTDAARSRLLHRLVLLGIGWGEPARGRDSKGTFRETWRLRWEPELAVRVAEAGIWGTTVVAAATARASDAAVHSATLAEVTATAEACLLADLPDALPVVMRVLADRAALDTDVAHLAAALPALVRAVRYGDVRGTDSAALGEVAAGLALRISVGLPPACSGLDADGAAAMRAHVDEVHRAVALLPDPALRDRWAAALRSVAERDGGIPGLLRGAAARLLRDDGRLDAEEAARLMGLALSAGTGPAESAGWIEGFLAGGGMLLVHDEKLLALVDGWLAGVPAAAFDDVLPLLRRTFAEFEPGVRRTVGELVRRGPSAGRRPGGAGAEPGLPGFGATLDPARADAAAHTVRLLLGTTTTTDLGTQGEGEADDD